MTGAAVIPMHTPEEAIAELEFAVRELKMKVVMPATYVRRPVPAAERRGAGRLAPWHDSYGLDSPHDYDPVWQKCLELGVNPIFHTGTLGVGTRRSLSSYVHNHLGHFAAAAEATCRSLFLGGVTRRFPELRSCPGGSRAIRIALSSPCRSRRPSASKSSWTSGGPAESRPPKTCGGSSSRASISAVRPTIRSTPGPMRRRSIPLARGFFRGTAVELAVEDLRDCD